MKLKVVIHEAEDGRFWAEVPGFPGCVSEGDTLDEIRCNIREAFEGIFEVLQERGPDPESRQVSDRTEELEV